MGLMSFPRPTHWYHSHSDLIWPDSTFNNLTAFHFLNTSMSSPGIRDSQAFQATTLQNLQNLVLKMFKNFPNKKYSAQHH
jgi:hypothetical protein